MLLNRAVTKVQQNGDGVTITDSNGDTFEVSNTINCFTKTLFEIHVQVNLDMTDSMGPGKLVRHMQNPSYAYDEYLICIGLGPSISSVICKNPSYSGPSYPGSPVYLFLYVLSTEGETSVSMHVLFRFTWCIYRKYINKLCTVPTFNSCTKCMNNPGMIHNCMSDRQ